MNELPEFSEFGIAAIKLLQGVVYQEDKDVWAILLANESDIETYFCRIGTCLLYTSPSPRDRTRSRMPSSA